MRLATSIFVGALVVAVLLVYDGPVVGAQGSDLCDSASTRQFSDVETGDYGAAYILCMRTLGMSLGRADGGYGPDAVLTRAQMASFVVRLWRDVLDRECPGGGVPFIDVPSGSPHLGNIECMYNLGITRGVTATRFAPQDQLTASQISRFLLRTYEKSGNSCPDATSELERAVNCLEARRVIPTTAEGRSSEAVTRAQMAVYVVGLWHNIAGRGLPPTPPRLGETTSTGRAADGTFALDVLTSLTIAPERRTGYDRDLFTHWSDLDGDGCDTRREILMRDSRVVSTLDPSRTCWVVAGLWYSHYDDQWETQPESLDIDHLVPLAEAWDSGASGWSRSRREAFANDEGALVAVTARSNRQKGADDPAEWMPTNSVFTCPYASAWVAVKARWELAVDQREASFLNGLFAGECTGSTLTIETPVLAFPVLDTPDLDIPDLGTPEPVDEPDEIPPNPGNTKNCSDFDTHAEAQAWHDRYFPHYGDVGKLDRDKDGVVCESLP